MVPDGVFVKRDTQGTPLPLRKCPQGSVPNLFEVAEH